MIQDVDMDDHDAAVEVVALTTPTQAGTVPADRTLLAPHAPDSAAAVPPPPTDMAAPTAWHKLSNEEALSTLGSRMGGLHEAEAAAALRRWGPNRLTVPDREPVWRKFLQNLVGGFQLMLWVGASLCILVYLMKADQEDRDTMVLGVVMITIVVSTTVFQTYQEGQADHVMESLLKMAPASATVVRAGVTAVIPASALVPGDVVELAAGDKVPADIRVLWAEGLQADNAALTGENIDVGLTAEHGGAEEIFEARNVARAGCSFVAGKGLGLVFATGDRTFFGQISASVSGVARPDTLLQHEIHRLINFMAVVASTLGVTFFLLALARGYTLLEALIFMIGIGVANEPEGPRRGALGRPPRVGGKGGRGEGV